MKKSCCAKETCRHNRDHANSSPNSDSPSNIATADKATQMTPNQDMSSLSSDKVSVPHSSEYDVFYDCVKEKSKHPKIDMSHVYESMENPELFRGTLMQVMLLTQQLLNYFEQPPILAPSECKLLKNNSNSKQKAKCYSCDQEVAPSITSFDRKPDKTSSSSGHVQLQMPMELRLESLYDKFTPRDFSKCTNPLCSDIAKAAAPYMEAAGVHVQTPSEAQIRESSSNYYSCISTDDQCELPVLHSKYSQTTSVPLFDVGFMPPCWCQLSNPQKLDLLNRCQSSNYQMTCLPSLDENHIPPCWCSLNNNEATSKPDLLCECGVKPDSCICDKLKEEKLVESPKDDEITKPSSSPSAPVSTNADEHTNAEPCSCIGDKLTLEELEESVKKPQHEGQKPLICEDQLHLSRDLKKPLPPPKPPRKVYRMVFPQHKDLDICVKCRFEPSPLIDEAGNVICPGNCGCCLCPWKTRATYSAEDLLRHTKIKVCKCRDRCTLFTGITKIDSACSQSSYFDFCPCREKAESKHIELYGTEMAKQILQGDEVLLTDVRELVPAKQGSTRFLTSTLYNEKE